MISKFYISFIECGDFKQRKVSVQWSEDLLNRVEGYLFALKPEGKPG
jgi:hypothetical protein